MSRNSKFIHKDGLNSYSGLVQVKNGRRDFSGALQFFPDRLNQPLKMRKPAIWFVNSLSDLYHEALQLEMLQRIFEVMNEAYRHGHVFQILTKRPARMMEIAAHVTWARNIWQGVTFEGIPAGMPEGQQRALLRRIDALHEHPAKIKFISFEPLIGPSPNLDLSGIDWAFFGGESHPSPQQARPMDLQWLRDGIALCERHGCKPFVKQLGCHWALTTANWPPPKGTNRSEYGRWRMGKPRAGAWPDDLTPYAIDSMREITPEKLGKRNPIASKPKIIEAVLIEPAVDLKTDREKSDFSIKQEMARVKCTHRGKYIVKRGSLWFCALCRDLRKNFDADQQKCVNDWLAAHEEQLESPSLSVFALRVSDLHVPTEDDNGQSRLDPGEAIKGEVEADFFDYHVNREGHPSQNGGPRVCISGINEGSVRAVALKYGLTPSMVFRIRKEFKMNGPEAATERLLEWAERKLPDAA